MKAKILIVSVFVVFALTSVFALRSPSRAAGSEVLIESGPELFKANCARCHGDTGEGGKGPNLTTDKKKAKWKDSDAKLVNKIRKGGLFMPSFKEKLSEADIKSIAAHVRQLPAASK